jgi:hypothetical protein
MRLESKKIQLKNIFLYLLHQITNLSLKCTISKKYFPILIYSFKFQTKKKIIFKRE